MLTAAASFVESDDAEDDRMERPSGVLTAELERPSSRTRHYSAASNSRSPRPLSLRAQRWAATADSSDCEPQQRQDERHSARTQRNAHRQHTQQQQHVH